MCYGSKGLGETLGIFMKSFEDILKLIDINNYLDVCRELSWFQSRHHCSEVLYLQSND